MRAMRDRNRLRGADIANFNQVSRIKTGCAERRLQRSKLNCFTSQRAAVGLEANERDAGA
jgi:hypothetical protein